MPIKMPNWFTKEIKEIEKLITNLTNQANMDIDFYDNYPEFFMIKFHTGWNPYLISLITEAFSSGNKKWKLSLELSPLSGHLLLAVYLSIDETYNKSENLIHELLYKRGVLKLKLEKFYKRVFSTE